MLNMYDLGILPGSAYQCIPGNVYLRSDLSRRTPSNVRCMVSERTSFGMHVPEPHYSAQAVFAVAGTLPELPIGSLVARAIITVL